MIFLYLSNIAFYSFTSAGPWKTDVVAFSQVQSNTTGEARGHNCPGGYIAARPNEPIWLRESPSHRAGIETAQTSDAT
jgi:hypothetical protein